MSREYVTALRESLEKKQKVLEEILRLCKMQQEVLSSEKFDAEKFDALVDDKDICIEKLEKLDEGFELVYSRVESELKDNKAQYSEDIRSMQERIKTITELSTKINALEERNRKGVSDALIKERKGLSEGKRSVNVAMHYYKNMSGLNVNDSRYMDKKK